jgi:hypothetical protein
MVNFCCSAMAQADLLKAPELPESTIKFKAPLQSAEDRRAAAVDYIDQRQSDGAILPSPC